MKDRKHYFLIISLILLAGCRTISPSSPAMLLSMPAQDSAAPLYLDTVENQSLRLETFLKNRTSLNEMDKIRYLFSAIQSSPYQFKRNGSIYDGSQAMRWLRWKMGHAQFRSNPIRTANDFVMRVADRSLATGQPYEVILTDKSKQTLQPLLENELAALERAVMDRILRETADHQTVVESSASLDTLKTAPLAPLTSSK